MAKKILVSAGDPSGDLILAKVVEELKLLDPSLEFVGLCGPASEKAGVRKIASAADVAVVGIVEVLFNLRKIFGVLSTLAKELDTVDSVLCVDFPDFNLKLAQIARKKAKPVDYIIAPQVWAWRSGRMTVIRERIRRLYVALPFEHNLFRDQGIDTRFLGHPIRDLLPPKNRRSAREALGFKDTDFVLLLMPGSRKNEISRQLPLMLKALDELASLAKRYPSSVKVNEWKWLLPLAPGWTKEMFMHALPRKEADWVQKFVQQKKLVLDEDSRRCIMAADFGWITSGTATLEAAFYLLPHILIYKLSRISAFLIRQNSQYFSKPNAAAGLPNILLNKNIIPELLQDDLNPRRLALDSLEMISNQGALAKMRRELRYLPKVLGEVGSTQRIAQDLFALWSPKECGNA